MGEGASEQSEFVALGSSKLEPVLIERICQPILERVPERIHPNTISLTNHVLSWIVVWMAISSPQAGAVGQPLLLVLAGIGMFCSMILDNLDGMQARRTNRCSKLGEMMDHWLDAIHVPLANVGMAMALQLPPWGVVGVVISGTMIYHAQVLYYHLDRVFIHPPTSGTDAQFGLSCGFIGAAVGFAIFSRDNYWVDLVLSVAAGYATFRQVWVTSFFYPKLGKRALPHVQFVVLCGGFGALYLLGAISAIAFVLVVTFISFRLSGSYVLYSIIRRRYAGNDWGIVAWIALIAAAFLLAGAARGGVALPASLAALGPSCRAALPYLPYAAIAYLVGRNLFAFFAHLGELRPGASAR